MSLSLLLVYSHSKVETLHVHMLQWMHVLKSNMYNKRTLTYPVASWCPSWTLLEDYDEGKSTTCIILPYSLMGSLISTNRAFNRDGYVLAQNIGHRCSSNIHCSFINWGSFKLYVQITIIISLKQSVLGKYMKRTLTIVIETIPELDELAPPPPYLEFNS